DRGPLGLRARGGLLLRADRVEPRAHPGGAAFLPLRAPVGVAAAAREAAQAAGRGLARAGLARLLPRSGRARRDADRADRRARDALGGSDLSRLEIGLGLQSDKRPEAYVEIARRAEAAGVDVFTVFHDLYYQPAIAPLLLIAEATESLRVGPAALNPW